MTFGESASILGRLARRARAAPVAAALCMLSTNALAADPAPKAAADASIVKTLQAHRWTLQSASDAAGRPADTLPPSGRSMTMSFDGARLSVEGACNRMNGGWRLSPQGQLLIGRLAATMKACEEALMRADAALSAVLAQPMNIELIPGATSGLRLSTAGNGALAFSGEPTLRSLYGAPRRIFLEVAAQPVECKRPSGEVGNCLQVRERHYDRQGLPEGKPGTWRPFAERIEGYTHTPGVRNVLRIDRYERRPAPAGGPVAVYVLDLVVESESVAR